jgi:hypothetical protein
MGDAPAQHSAPSNQLSSKLPLYALSLKQPWATLLVYGHKTVEIRRWPTSRRGVILIHAAGVGDDRKEAWAQLPSELRDASQLRGGIIGCGELINCVAYRNRASFAADQARHRNEPSWFEDPLLYGFTFMNLQRLPFRAYPGWRRFFPVHEEPPRKHRRATGERAV